MIGYRMDIALGPADFLNDNSISQIAFGFFMAILTCLGLALRWVRKTLKTAIEARSEAATAAGEAATAAKKIEPLSNGFAGKMSSKLDKLTELASQNNQALDDVQKQLTTHLNWHLDKEKQNG